MQGNIFSSSSKSSPCCFWHGILSCILFLRSINYTILRRVHLEILYIDNKLMPLLYFGRFTHGDQQLIKEIMACNSLLDLVNLVQSDYVQVLADHLSNGIHKQSRSSGLINSDQVAYNYINNALTEARLLDCLADVAACLSPAYASIDTDRQYAPVDHAFMASTRHN